VTREFTQAEANRHDALAAKGWALTEGCLVLNGQEMLGRPNWFVRWRLRRATRCFERALEINPDGWPSMWALGKIHQRLGEQAAAFDWFTRAHAIKPDQPDVAREAGIAALDIGRVKDGLELCQTAVACNPDDAGLVANLALAHCLAGDDAEAQRCAAEAVERAPGDTISAAALSFVRAVASGERRRPERLCDVFPYG
jgi:Flp pilus assembly protein TadD